MQLLAPVRYWLENLLGFIGLEAQTLTLSVGGMVNKGIQSILATSKNTTVDKTAEGESNKTQAEQEAELSNEDLMLDDL